MTFARRVLAIAWKDLVAEWRDRESLTAMCFFAFLVLFLFNFALGGDQTLIRGAASGLLWLAFAFTSVLGLARSVQGELANDCLDGLLLYPAEREAIFLGKLCGSFSIILLVELISFPIFAVLYNMDIWSQLPKLLLITIPATLGFATAGTLLSTMTVGLRAREAMLPFLLFPMTIPLILAAVKGTEVVLRREAFELAMPWLKLMAAFDLLFLVGSLLTFELLVEE
ncbi:MAG: cytochrome C biogenesis protein [Candidatus Methylomirabilis oxygeniifera]|nr:MAG: cytochrome C biogenesis protein [Candidatus Methylomirabilis oxyfera]